jgi:hypothetical protein
LVAESFQKRGSIFWRYSLDQADKLGWREARCAEFCAG